MHQLFLGHINPYPSLLLRIVLLQFPPLFEVMMNYNDMQTLQPLIFSSVSHMQFFTFFWTDGMHFRSGLPVKIMFKWYVLLAIQIIFFMISPTWWWNNLTHFLYQNDWNFGTVQTQNNAPMNHAQHMVEQEWKEGEKKRYRERHIDPSRIELKAHVPQGNMKW